MSLVYFLKRAMPDQRILWGDIRYRKRRNEIATVLQKSGLNAAEFTFEGRY